MNTLISKWRICRRLIALAVCLTFFLNLFGTELFALAPQSGIEDASTRCEYRVACLFRTGLLRFASSPEDVAFLDARNHARALLLPHGKILISGALKDRPGELLQAIIHEETEAIMQIMAREDPAKYYTAINMILGARVKLSAAHSPLGPKEGIVDLKEAFIRLFPEESISRLTDAPLDNELLANHIIAKAFELIIARNDNLLTSGLSDREKVFVEAIEGLINANKHNYFTGVFWDDSARHSKIRIAVANGMRFAQVAAPLSKVSGGAPFAEQIESLTSSGRRIRTNSVRALLELDEETVAGALTKDPLWPKGLDKGQWRNVLEGFILASELNWQDVGKLGQAGYPALAIEAMFGSWETYDGYSDFYLGMADYETFIAYLSECKAQIFNDQAMFDALSWRNRHYVQSKIIVDVLDHRKVPGRFDSLLVSVEDNPGNDNKYYIAFQQAVYSAIVNCGPEAIPDLIKLVKGDMSRHALPVLRQLPLSVDAIVSIAEKISPFDLQEMSKRLAPDDIDNLVTALCKYYGKIFQGLELACFIGRKKYANLVDVAAQGLMNKYDTDGLLRRISDTHRMRLNGEAPFLVYLLTLPNKQIRAKSAKALLDLDEETVAGALTKDPLWPKGLDKGQWRNVLEGFILASERSWQDVEKLGQAGYPALAIEAMIERWEDYGRHSDFYLGMADYETFIAYLSEYKVPPLDDQAILDRLQKRSYYVQKKIIIDMLNHRRTPGRLEPLLGLIEDYEKDSEYHMAYQHAVDTAIANCGMEASDAVRELVKDEIDERIACLIDHLPVDEKWIETLLVKGMHSHEFSAIMTSSKKLLELDSAMVYQAIKEQTAELVSLPFKWPDGLAKEEWRGVLEGIVAFGEGRLDNLLKVGKAAFIPLVLSRSHFVELPDTVGRWLIGVDFDLFKTWVEYTGNFMDNHSPAFAAIREIDKAGNSFSGEPVDIRRKIKYLLEAQDAGAARQAIDISIKGLKDDISIMLTDRCPFNCDMCITRLMRREGHGDLPKKDLIKIIDQLRGFSRIRFVGPGETMVYGKKSIFDPGVSEDFLEVVRHASEAAKEVWILTNGALIPTDIEEARKLLALFPKNVVWVLSVDNDHAAEMAAAQDGKSLADVVKVLETMYDEKVIQVRYFTAFWSKELFQIYSDYGIEDARRKSRVTSFPVVRHRGISGKHADNAKTREGRHIARHSLNEESTNLFIDMDGFVTGSNHAAFMTGEDRKALDPVNVFGNINEMPLARILLERYRASIISYRRRGERSTMQRPFEISLKIFGTALVRDDRAFKEAINEFKELSQSEKNFASSEIEGTIAAAPLVTKSRLAVFFSRHLSDLRECGIFDDPVRIFGGMAILYADGEDLTPAGSNEINSADNTEKTSLPKLNTSPEAQDKIAGMDALYDEYGGKYAAENSGLVGADSMPEWKDFAKTLDWLACSYAALFGAHAVGLNKKTAELEKENRSLILYADDLLESAAIADLEHSVKNIFVKHNLLARGKIILFGRKAENIMIMKTLLERAGIGAESIETILEDKNITKGNDTGELEMLLTAAKRCGALNGENKLLGLVRGPLKQKPEQDDQFIRNVKEHKLPVVIVGAEKGIYSFTAAIAGTISIASENGQRGWFIQIEPIRRITKELENQYEQYKESLRALQAA